MALLCHLAKLKQNFKFILGSGSPRRFEILSELGIEFTVIESDFEEAMDPVERAKLRESGPESYVSFLARSKAQDVFEKVKASSKYLPGSDGKTYFVVIGADTIVVDGSTDEILEKGKTPDNAKAMLLKLSGKSHKVITGVTVLVGTTRGEESSMEDVSAQYGTEFAETTEVTFRDVGTETIDAYVETGEPLDKAGSYGIQGLGGLLVKGINGCHRNVIGFPLSRFAEELCKKLPLS